MAKKSSKKQAAPAAADDRPSLSAHPRARRQIRAAKAWAGLCGFILVQLLGLKAGLPFADVLVRALLAGVGAYVIGWGVAVLVWRQLAVAELEALRKRLTAPSEPEGQGA